MTAQEGILGPGGEGERGRGSIRRRASPKGSADDGKRSTLDVLVHFHLGGFQRGKLISKLRFAPYPFGSTGFPLKKKLFFGVGTTF